MTKRHLDPDTAYVFRKINEMGKPKTAPNATPATEPENRVRSFNALIVLSAIYGMIGWLLLVVGVPVLLSGIWQVMTSASRGGPLSALFNSWLIGVSLAAIFGGITFLAVSELINLMMAIQANTHEIAEATELTSAALIRMAAALEANPNHSPSKDALAEIHFNAKRAAFASEELLSIAQRATARTRDQ
jgi:hypothetical protein